MPRKQFRKAQVALLSCCLGLLLIAAPATAQSDATKIAVIDVQRILQESVKGKAVIEELAKLRQEKMAELQAQRDEVAELEKRLQEMRLSLSEERIAEMQQEAEDKAISLRRAQDDAQRLLQKRQEEDFQALEREIMPVINAVGKEFGYSLIFNKFQSGLVYADETTDITDLVVERYNSMTQGK